MMSFIEEIARSGDPSTRYKLALAGIGANGGARRKEIRRSKRVAMLLSERNSKERIERHPYTKWTGAHWVLATLADLGYPSGDRSLVPLRDQVLEWLLDERRVSPHRATREAYLAPISTVSGRPRIHASLEGNALYAILALGIADARVDALAERLVELQWEDGGWNCDRAPSASCSSFEETLIPLRGLIWHARERKSRASASAAKRAAEVFLKRSLFKRLSTGKLIERDFVELHYPCYWHYDVLFALKVLAEGGFIGDARCDDALSLLRSRRRPDGGFSADAKFWTAGRGKGHRSLASWGPVGKTRSNEFVTADALLVLEQARRAKATRKSLVADPGRALGEDGATIRAHRLR
jgi:hypothetical protein